MIRQLTRGDVEAFSALRRQALDDAPLAFASSPADDFARTMDEVGDSLDRAPKAVIFGAISEDGALVGSVGLMVDRHLKAAHKAHLWGMYVQPQHRRAGHARALLKRAIAHARELPGVRWVHLGVSEAAPGARRLYLSAGFQVWGTEPEALQHGGRTVSEDYMALALR